MIAVAESGSPVPAIKADLAFEPAARSVALHRTHGSVPRGCAACHELAEGGTLADPRQSCFGCHPGQQALAGSACAGCHREHGDEWAPAPVQDDLQSAASVAFTQGALGVLGLLLLAGFGMAGHAIAELAQRAEDKAVFHRHCAEAGLPTPGARACASRRRPDRDPPRDEDPPR